MIKLKTSKEDRIMSDGRYFSNGIWICDTTKIPYGELLQEKVDIFDNGKQLDFLSEIDTNSRDFSSLIPKHQGTFDLVDSGVIVDTNRGKYRLYTDNDTICAFVLDSAIKCFDDVKIHHVSTNDNNRLVEFYNKDDEFVFGVMPANIVGDFENTIRSLMYCINLAVTKDKEEE